jgi:hypothetical protein
VPANPNDSKEIEFLNEKLEIQSSDVIDPDASVHDFRLFYKVDFDFDAKTSIHPCELFYHHVNPQKKLMLGSICLKGQTRLNISNFPNRQIPKFS